MTQEELVEMHRGIVNRFVIRARRVASHSLFDDRDKLRSYARVEFKATMSSEGQLLGLRTPVPKEEELESLAARVRPLLLKRDTVFMPSAIRSVQYFARLSSNEAVYEMLERVRAEALKHVEPSGLGGFSVQIQRAFGEDMVEMTDFDLADSWLNGDVVHANPNGMSSPAEFDIDERFRAAVGVYTRTAIQAATVLEHVKRLRVGGVDVCSTGSLEEPVVATVIDGHMNHFKDGTVGRVFVAPVGTPSPPFPSKGDTRSASPGFPDTA
jgi:hypothetical protein